MANVSGAGRVTAVGAGTAIITAKVKGDGREYATATCRVVVKEGEMSVRLDESSISLDVGSNQTLSAYVTPESATLSWSSSDTSVATVSDSGRVSAVGAGSATITLTAQSGSKTETASCEVNVVNAESVLGFYGMKVPSGQVYFGSFSVAGQAASNYRLTTLKYRVSDTSTGTIDSGSLDMGGANTYSVIEIVCDMMKKVTYPGTFEFWLQASDSSGKTAEYSSTFTISQAS